MSIKKIKPNGQYKSGLFKPINPDKYIGDFHNIICRSSWEQRFCTYCDRNENILKWSSEPLSIDYWNPLDKKQHKYYVDFYIKTLREDGSTQEWIIEVKPEAQTKKPLYEGKNMTLKKLEKYNYDMKIWITNQAKFKAARDWADQRGFRFGVVDENFLFKSQ
jgi:hypothetical protein